MSVFSTIEPLVKPETIAVIGASEKFGAGSLVIKNLQALGFKGRIIPINPRYESVLSMPCYPSLLDVPDDIQIDCAAILLGGNHLLPVLKQAAERNIKGAWAFASGFAETGPEGRIQQEELQRYCVEKGIRFCGPNCVGFINMHDRTAMFSAPLSPTLTKGPVAAVAQSGSVILALANSNRGLGFSTIVSSGNEAVLDMVDYIEYFLEDEPTKVIIAFIEGIRRPRAFRAVCERAAELGKPIIAVKVGRSELAQKTVATHTGALAGADDVYDIFFRQAGVIRVTDLDQLMETAELFAYCGQRLPAGNRVGMMTVSGGEIGLIGDLSKGLALDYTPLTQELETRLREKLPPYTNIGNPLDGWGSGDLRGTYAECLSMLAEERQYDLIAVSQDSPTGMSVEQVAQYSDVADAAVKAAEHGKPLVVFSNVSGGLDPTIKNILNRGGVPLLQGTAESLNAMDQLIRYAKFRRTADKIKVSPANSLNGPRSFSSGLETYSGVLPYTETRAVLSAFDFDLSSECLVQTLAEAGQAASELGYPVALKAMSAQIPHKTEAGLVELGITDLANLEASYARVVQKVAEYGSNIVLDGILIQKMAPADAVETIVGVNYDPVFGPVVLVGIGGIFVEVFKDFSLGLPPFNLEHALQMISELKGNPLLKGVRGKPKADVAALAELLVKTGRMALELKNELISLDLNPVMVLPEGRGTRIVDIVFETGPRANVMF